MTGRIAWGVAIGLGFGLAAPVARAQPGADPALQEKAADLVQRGIECQSKRDTPCAVRLYTEAYCLIPEPALIYNIGTAYQEGGKPGEAMRAFKLYLKTAPGGELAKESKAKIAQLKPAATGEGGVMELTCKKATTPPPVPASCAPGQTMEGGKCVAIASTQGPGDTAPSGETPNKGRSWLLYAGIGTAAIGVAGMSAGIAYGIKAKNASDALSGHEGPWTAEDLAKQDEGASAEKKQIAFMVIGGVALAGGATMVILSLRKGGRRAEQPMAELVPVLTPTGGGLTLRGRY